MIAIYLFFVILSMFSYFILSKKFRIGIRILFSVAIFVLPSLFFTLWILKVGDQAPADSVEVYQKK